MGGECYGCRCNCSGHLRRGMVDFPESDRLLGLVMLYAFIKWIDDMFKPTKKLIAQWNAFGKLYASLER